MVSSVSLYVLTLRPTLSAWIFIESKRVWSTLTNDYFVSNPSFDAIKLVVQLVDIRTGPTDDDIMMINFLIEMQIPFIVATTKTDKLSKSALKLALEELENTYFKDTGIDIIPFSSVTRDGKDELWKRIYDAVSK